MIDFNTTQVRVHRRNIQRYCRLLATELTDLERQYLHKRIARSTLSLNNWKRRHLRGSASADNVRDKQIATSLMFAHIAPDRCARPRRPSEEIPPSALERLATNVAGRGKAE
jgi:hypothetical protein